MQRQRNTPHLFSHPGQINNLLEQQVIITHAGLMICEKHKGTVYTKDVSLIFFL